MRLSFFPVILLLLIADHAAFAQTGVRKTCGNELLSQLQRQLSPDYDRRIQENNLRIRDRIRGVARSTVVGLNGNGTGLPGDSVYTIPVVIHIIYPAGEAYGTGSNISYAQIRSQLEALNAAFSRSYPGYNGQAHPGYAQNARIRFCLARNPTPATASWATGPGGIEYGVRRYADNSGAYNHEMSLASASKLMGITHGTNNHFPFDQYLNIWVVKSINGNSGIMGYAQPPLAGVYPLDGVVMRSDIFGDNTTGSSFPLGYGLMQGKVLSHEIGHYFDLHHIFEGGCSGTNGPSAATDACDLNGDYICDTRPSNIQHVSCSDTALTSCPVNYDPGTSAHDMVNNYMSYADDDCMNTFTNDQVQRMRAVLQMQRRNLWQAANLAVTGVLGNSGCVPAFLNAAITLHNDVICAGKPIQFSNPKAGNTAVTRQWRFTGGTPASGSSDTMRVVFDVPGNYTAVITVSDGSTTISDSLPFTVEFCQLDSARLSMAHWYFADYCSIDFSAGTAVRTSTAVDKKSIHLEMGKPGQVPYMAAPVSVSDSLGNLQFYSNGVSVWNSNHDKISTGPVFGVSDINYSSGMSYIPYPGKPGIYYMTGVYPPLNGGSEGIRYVLVDVAANTVSTYQEISHPLLPRRFAQNSTVVPHCNGTDFWIITRGDSRDADHNFYVFKVTVSGINQEPVISTGFASRVHNGGGFQLKANRTGDKLFLSSFDNALYDFDSRTGKVSNEKFIPGAPNYINAQSGAAFSPNGKYVFLMRSGNLDHINKPYALFQYRVDDLVYRIIPTTGLYNTNTFQLGPDNRLYILNGGEYLARLSDPDTWGGGSFNERYLSFYEPPYVMRAWGSGLPAFIDAKRKEPWSPDFSIQPVDCRTYTFNVLCFENYTATWDFGDGTPLQTGHSATHTYAKSGEYKVTLSLSSSTNAYGSVTKKITALPTTIAFTGSDSVCTGNPFASQYFAPAYAEASYQWSVSHGSIAGPNDRSRVDIDWSKANPDTVVISLEVALNSSCMLRASQKVRVNRPPVFNWVLPDSVCITEKSITLNVSPAGGIYSGTGVNNGVFSPDSAGLGNHVITYRYGQSGNCYGMIWKMIRVYNSCGVVTDPPVIVPPVVVPPVTTVPPVVVPPVTGGGTTDSISIPNIFSPNNDGINDTWRIPFLQAYPGAVISIYDRYGLRVFHSTGYSKDWDGRHKNKDLPIGTYYYIIAVAPGRKPLSGSISILR